MQEILVQQGPSDILGRRLTAKLPGQGLALSGDGLLPRLGFDMGPGDDRPLFLDERELPFREEYPLPIEGARADIAELPTLPAFGLAARHLAKWMVARGAPRFRLPNRRQLMRVKAV